MSEQQKQDPKIKELSDKVESLQKELDEQSKIHSEEISKKLEEQAKEFEAKKADFLKNVEEHDKEQNKEIEKLKMELKKLAESKGVKVNINPKGCYSDSKTRRAKVAEEEAKKSKSKKD